jgi:hypothetical protein
MTQMKDLTRTIDNSLQFIRVIWEICDICGSPFLDLAVSS